MVAAFIPSFCVLSWLLPLPSLFSFPLHAPLFSFSPILPTPSHSLISIQCPHAKPALRTSPPTTSTPASLRPSCKSLATSSVSTAARKVYIRARPIRILSSSGLSPYLWPSSSSYHTALTYIWLVPSCSFVYNEFLC